MQHLALEASPSPRPPLERAASAPPVAAAAVLTSKESEERRQIVEALERCSGNQTRAAKLLGIARATLVNKLSIYRIPRPRK